MRKIDCHLHVMCHDPKAIVALADQYGYDKYCVLAVPSMGLKLNHFECLAVKAQGRGRAFAFGGLTYENGAQNDFDDQLDRLLTAGFDGVKFIETKPTLMKQIGVPLDDPCLDGVFARLEREQIPVLWHVGDPAPFWDSKTAPAFAVENGWCYDDGTFPSLEALYQQAENVLKRHPMLPVCFAHFYFSADDIAHAQRLMETYPNVRFDLTPGVEMYPLFMANREKWRPFFMQYRHRILFGTDGTDDAGERDIYAHLSKLVRCFLEDTGPFQVWDIQGEGFGFDVQTLEAIYCRNFEAWVGHTPKPLDAKGVQAMAQAILPSLSPEEKQTLQTLLDSIRPY